MEYLELYNKPKAVVHPERKLTDPKKKKKKKKKKEKKRLQTVTVEAIRYNQIRSMLYSSTQGSVIMHFLQLPRGNGYEK